MLPANDFGLKLASVESAAQDPHCWLSFHVLINSRPCDSQLSGQHGLPLVGHNATS